MTQKIADVATSMAAAVKGYVERRLREIGEAVEDLRAQLKAIPQGPKGERGEQGIQGEKGADGIGLAGAMIDRDGVLIITKSNGDAIRLGSVVGRDGVDGLSVESIEREYLPDTHEISEKWTAGGRTKELRYPAGGIRPGGYWRDGTKAAAGQAWTHDGCLWIARKETTSKPNTQADDWYLAARKGRDGERGPKGGDGASPAPIPLKG